MTFGGEMTFSEAVRAEARENWGNYMPLTALLIVCSISDIGLHHWLGTELVVLTVFIFLLGLAIRRRMNGEVFEEEEEEEEIFETTNPINVGCTARAIVKSTISSIAFNLPCEDGEPYDTAFADKLIQHSEMMARVILTDLGIDPAARGELKEED